MSRALQDKLAELPTAPAWMKWVLLLAAAYNLLWGAWVVLLPNAYFDWAEMPRPTYPEIWQCVGMIVGVYGVGYAIAAFDPLRHWPIVLVGLMGKVLGPIGFAKALLDGTFTPKAGMNILTNDLIWWMPFALILYAALRNMVSRPYRLKVPMTLEESLASHRLNDDLTLGEASGKRPLLMCFLRHYG